MTPAYVEALESSLDEINATLPPLKEFILPGGGGAATATHVARAVCRRAERRLLALARRDEVNVHSRVYLNRLSDLFFVLARYRLPVVPALALFAGYAALEIVAAARARRWVRTALLVGAAAGAGLLMRANLYVVY